MSDDFGFTECCKQLLGTFLNWTGEEVVDWAEQYQSEARDPYSLFNRETPVYYCVPLIIPESICNALPGMQIEYFAQKIEFAILDDKEYWEMNSNDWLAAKSRIETMLAEFGERLENAPGMKRHTE